MLNLGMMQVLVLHHGHQIWSRYKSWKTDHFDLIGKHLYLQFQKIPKFRPTLRAPTWYDITRKRDLYIITHMELTIPKTWCDWSESVSLVIRDDEDHCFGFNRSFHCNERGPWTRDSFDELFTWNHHIHCSSPCRPCHYFWKLFQQLMSSLLVSSFHLL